MNVINIKIKVKEITKEEIKTMDKGLIITDKLKNTIVEVKEKTNNIADLQNDNSNEYTINNINNAIENTTKNSIYIYNKLRKNL